MTNEPEFIESNFLRLLGNRSAMRIVELFIEESPNNLNKTEVGIKLSMGRNTLYKVWDLLDEYHILKTVDSIGRGRIYVLDKENRLTMLLIKVKAAIDAP